jgi:Spy/CpxP family protein refolding chaperone
MFTKRTLWLSIIVSMIIGGVAGFEIERYRMQSDDSHFGKTRFINYMTKELSLTQTQRQQLDSIITYSHPKFHAIREKFNADIQGQMDSTRKMITNILTGEQQQKFQILLKQMRSNSDNH